MHLSGKLGGAPVVSHHRARQLVANPCVPSASGRCAPLESAIDQQGCTHHYQVPRRSKRPSLRVAARKAATPPEAPEEPASKGKGDEQGTAASTRTPRDQKLTGPEILERGSPEHPYPGEYQQTLIASFTLGGIGLHTGDYAYVRVRPAFAGEGRYIVRVPVGTNEGHMEVTSPVEVSLEDGGQMDVDPELEEKKVELFKLFLIAQEDEGFTGTFKQYLHDIDARDMLAKWQAGGDPQHDEWSFNEPEPIQARGEDEGVSAHIDEVYVPAIVTVALGKMDSPEKSVVGVELLLAALEACGVDNARIEIEGGLEIPQLDGSGLGWAMEIQFAGVYPAPCKDGQPGGVRREAVRYQGEPFTVTGQYGSYISFVPEDNMRITAGVDHHLVSQSVGKQWRSWSIFEDLPFRFDVGPARRWLPSADHLKILAAYGFYKGYNAASVNVATDDSWLDPSQVRFVRDEVARHEIMITLGVMSLNAKPGHAGLPFGHITSYKASPQLRLAFLCELRSRMSEDQWVPVWDVPLNIDPDVDQLQQYLEFNEELTRQLIQAEDGEDIFAEDNPVMDADYDEGDEGALEGEEEEGEEEEPPVVDV